MEAKAIPVSDSEPSVDLDDGEGLVVALDGFDGPLHVLLDLARAQKVDLAKIALAPLVDQYLAFVEAAKGKLDLAAEYLVMASWLTLLKSRLLLPKPERPKEEPDPEAIGEALRRKLMRLAEARAAGAALWALPQLGRDVFQNGAPAPVALETRPAWRAGLHDLLSAYCAGRSRGFKPSHKISPRRVYTLEAARRRLEESLAALEEWRPIVALRPPADGGPDAPSPKSYVASLLGAALELVRDQKLEARQAEQGAPLMLRARRP